MSDFPKQVINTATTNYQYIVNPSDAPVSDSNTSNQAITNVDILSLEMIKSSNKSAIATHDTLTYSIQITNNSSFSLTNLFFVDTIPSATSFIPGSVIIDGTTQAYLDPTVGFTLPSLAPYATTRISFNVYIDRLPCPLVLKNQASLTYSYRLAPTEPIQTRTAYSNVVSTELLIPTFKQFSVDQLITLPTCSPKIDTLLSCTIDTKVTHTEIITTPVGTSNEGQILTGKKLMVHGLILATLEYSAACASQSIHVFKQSIPFCNFVVIPATFDDPCDIKVNLVTEDVFYDNLSCDTIFLNLALRIDALL